MYARHKSGGFLGLFVLSCLREKWDYKMTIRMLVGLLPLFVCLF